VADAVTTEIIRNGLIAITEEMKTNLMRTAYNMIIYEALDFTVGVLDAKGDTVSIGLGLPMFIRGMSDTAKAKLARFGGPEALKPGDVLLTNDAYLTGSHLNHMTFSVPIFWEGELLAFSSCMAHWQDIGGARTGMTADIYAEGLQMPIVKFYREGKLNEELLEVIRMNVRVPERAIGDLRAQVAAVKVGEKRFLELVAKYGRDAMAESIRAIMDQSEAQAREEVRKIPDGVYEAESHLDDDGVDEGKRVPIRVKVIVQGDEMTVDLSGVSAQVRGFYNSGETAGRSCAQVAFKCLTSAQDYPINDGAFRPLRIVLPPGKVVSAVKPAPMRYWMTYPMTVVDTIFKAIAPAIPHKVIAGHHADLLLAKMGGFHPRDGKLFLYTGGLIGGGWGAKQGEDGVSATIAINDGDTHNGPSEQVEAKFPLLVESYRLREDSGGPGRWRGGLGTEQIVRALSGVNFDSQIERVQNPPWGLFGGLSAAGNQVALQRKGEDELAFPSGKVLSRFLNEGDRFMLRSGGGGGFGSPLERELEALADDLRQGYVSPAAARQYYGVVLDKDGKIDVPATETRRAEMRAKGLPKDEPFTPPPQPGPAVEPEEGTYLRKALVAAGFGADRCCT
jgi:N-methylhydantoinase B